ncbi:hypothetical protein SNE40_014267 [Patella caerulea]|uniref:Uncharacterized protein n=1 Tax=Patella caerulea TaxID=87958 RepID=A0AAN8PSN6_PATCE
MFKKLLQLSIKELLQDNIKEFIKPLKEEIEDSKGQLLCCTLDLEQKIINDKDELEQYSRRNCVRINGIGENADENVEDVALEIFKSACPSFGHDHIENCHRVGRKRIQYNTEVETENGPRQIILRLSSYKTQKTTNE